MARLSRISPQPSTISAKNSFSQSAPLPYALETTRITQLPPDADSIEELGRDRGDRRQVVVDLRQRHADRVEPLDHVGRDVLDLVGDRPRLFVREPPVRRVVGDDAGRQEAAEIERHLAADPRVQPGRHHPGRDPVGGGDRVPHLFRGGGHLVGALHPVFDAVGSVVRGLLTRAPRVGGRTRWSDGAVARRRGGTGRPARRPLIAGRRRTRHDPRAMRTRSPCRRSGSADAFRSRRLLAIAPTSDTVRAFTAIRYAAERRSATSFGSRAAPLQHVGRRRRGGAPSGGRTVR